VDENQWIDNCEGVAMSLMLSDADEVSAAAVEKAFRTLSEVVDVRNNDKTRWIKAEIVNVPLSGVACKAFVIAAVAAATGSYMTMMIHGGMAYFSVTRTFYFPHHSGCKATQ